MDSAEKQKILSTSLIVGAILMYLSTRFPEEVIFPGHSTYFIITFYLTYPDSQIIRHFIVTFLLAFADLAFIENFSWAYRHSTSSYERLNQNCKVLLLEFFSLFILIKMMSKKEIYLEFKNSVIRTVIFLLEAYLKADGMVRTLQLIMGNTPTNLDEYVFIKCVMICGLQATLPGLIYLADTFFCCDVPIRSISLNGVIVLGKTGIIISVVGMVVEILQETLSNTVKFANVPYSALVIYAYYLFIYSHDSIKYAKHFTRKIE